jgi:ribosome-binding factor A
MGKRSRERDSVPCDDVFAGGHRHARLQQIIEEELAALLRDEVSDPALAEVKLTTVVLSVDYRSARVGFITGDESDRARVERAFERALPFLRTRLGDALDVKRVPSLRFVHDRDAAAAARAQGVLEAVDKCTR